MSRQAIDKTNAQFIEAFKHQDSGAAVDVYTSDAQVMPTNSPIISGKKDIQTFWQNIMDMGATSADLTTLNVEFHDDTAIEIGEYTLIFGDRMTDVGTFVVIWKRQADGSWKWHVDIFNTNLPTTS